jgi:DNA-binding response OmpR family regulator
MVSTTEKFVIAIVDDDVNVRTSLSLNLELEGYKVVECEDGEKAFEGITKEKPDIILLDLMMPKKGGLEVCRELRKAGIATPVIMLTARDTISDKVLGLDMGADDYVPKPFEMPELIARVKAQLRRTQNLFNVDVFQFSDIVIDFKAYKAERKSVPLELSAREYRLLRYLITKKGTVVTRDELLDEVWGYNSYPTTRTVDNHIARLRQKIEDNVEIPKHILTVHGVGYKFVSN